MPKYAILGGYTTESWKALIDNPETRKDAINKAAKEVGGSVETLYWSFGEDDFIAIADIPDDNSAAALAVGVASSGRLRNLRTIKLITADDFVELLGKAKAVTAAYAPPGSRQAIGVG